VSEPSKFEINTTMKIGEDGRVNISCNKGLWSVSAPSRHRAKSEAVRYFMQYDSDGEYDE